MKPISLPDVDVERLRMLRGQVKTVRQWLDGWSAGSGKTGPADDDVLRQLMIIFDGAISAAGKTKPLPVITKARMR